MDEIGLTVVARMLANQYAVQTRAKHVYQIVILYKTWERPPKHYFVILVKTVQMEAPQQKAKEDARFAKPIE